MVSTRAVSKGFTLVEILVVVLLLAVIAAIVIPRFSNAAEMARSSTLADNLRAMRTQVSVYKAEHIGVSPGYPEGDITKAATEAVFIAQMTMASDADGKTANPQTAGYDFGPYISNLSANPVNGKSTIQIVGNGQPFPSEADDSHGYVYQPSTLMFKADSVGVDGNNRSYSDY